MTITEAQAKVDAWINTTGVRYFDIKLELYYHVNETETGRMFLELETVALDGKDISHLVPDEYPESEWDELGKYGVDFIERD